MLHLNRFGSRSFTPVAVLVAASLSAPTTSWAQRIRIPEFQVQNVGAMTSTAPPQFNAAPQVQTPVIPGTSQTVVSPPLMQLPPLNPPTGAVPGAGFDAYGATTAPYSTAPLTQGPAVGGAQIFPPPNSFPWAAPDGGLNGLPPGTIAPTNGSPGVFGPPSPYLGDASWQSSNGAWPNSPDAWPNQLWSRARNDWWPRLIEHPRFRHTFLYGDGDGNELQINDVELATTLTCPGLGCLRQPLRFSPGFIFHFWGGPETSVTGADLPAQAYSAFLAFDYITSFSRPIGGELNFTTGMYTDFESITTNSLRLTGVGLGWFRLNPTTTFKVGIEYFDRVDIKLLPAGGFFLMPNPGMKLDIYFPRPKFAWRVPNNFNREVWGYIGGEYGGGSWTIERIGGLGDQVDINDIRVFVGREWLGPRGLTGFVEFGYVFSRQLVYRSDPEAPVDISDTFMIRSGLAF